jgi:hypothetical protein
VIVAVPLDEHVAAAVVIVGTAGTGSCAAILNDALTPDEHDPFDASTV